jgi:phospholipid/cholesterol/gamma-HCH transport system substrate-binding protein
MKQQTQLELVVGAFVLAGIAATAFLALKIASGSLLGGDTYLVSAEFANIGSLNPGGNVLVAGVPIGKVEAVHLDPKTFRAIVDLRLERSLKLPTDSSAAIKSAGLIGDKYVAVSPGGDPDFIAPGGKITETESDVDLASLISKVAFGSVQSDKPDKSDKK